MHAHDLQVTQLDAGGATPIYDSPGKVVGIAIGAAAFFGIVVSRVALFFCTHCCACTKTHTDTHSLACSVQAPVQATV
jgi:hypothetical protein